MSTKKEKVTKDNFDELLLKSVSEAESYIKEEQPLTESTEQLIENSSDESRIGE